MTRLFFPSARCPAWRGFLLAGALLVPTATQAVPFAQRATFDQASLPPASWRVVSGSPNGVSVQGKTLCLAPTTAGATALAYRFYPLRSGSRPAFGDFTAASAFRDDPRAAPLAFGLLDHPGDARWQVWVQYRGAGRQARLVCTGGRTEATPWKALALPAAPDALRLTRQGDLVEAEVDAGAARAVVGRWRGTLPAIVDFGLAALPAAEAGGGGAVSISALDIAPLPHASAYSQPLPRPGVPLVGAPTGSEKLYGYLWTPGEKPAITVHVASLKEVVNPVVLKTWVTDWQDHTISARDYPLRLAPGGERDVSVALPSGRAGTFHLWQRLTDASGAPLEAERVTDWAVTRAPLPSALPDSSPFGIHGEPFARVGAKWHRAWDYADLFWRDTEPQPGVWNWGPMDEFVGSDRAAGVDSLVVLCGAPAWASENPRGDLLRSPPRDMAAWANYCRQTARRYKGRVKYYEVWNEPNNNDLAPEGFFFLGPPEKYVQVLKAACAAVKAEDPQAQILAPSGTGQFLPFLQRVVDLGGLPDFDILSIHPYSVPIAPEVGYWFNDQKNYAYRVRAAREIMRKGGAMKPVWVSEIGFDLGEEPKEAGLPLTQNQIAAEALPGQWPNWSPGWSYRPADERRKAAFVPRFMVLTMALGVQKMFLHHRLLTGGQPFLAAPSFGWAARLLSTARYDRAYRWPGAKAYPWGTDVQAHGFFLGDGRYLLALWRVEDESLTMDAAHEKAVQGVQSAPLAGAVQRGIGGTYGPPPRTSYFDPRRVVPLSVALTLPAGARLFDLYGNPLPLPLAGRLPLDEAPRYLIFPRRPAPLAGRVTRGVPAPDPAPPAVHTAPTAGTLTSADVSAVRAVTRVEDLLPGARRLPLGDAARIKTANGHTLLGGLGMDGLGSLRWTVPAGTPARIRLALSVRAGDQANGDFNFGYRVTQGGRSRDLGPWPAWPLTVLGRGDGYANVQGVALSPVLSLKPGDTLEVTCGRDWGQIFDAWLVPAPLEDGIPLEKGRS